MLLGGLDRRRFRLTFVCPPELAAKLRGDIPPDVKLYSFNLEWPTQFTAILRLIRILRRERVDILHSHSFAGSMAASPIAWLCRVPLVIESAHGREAWRTGWKAKCYVDRFIGRFVNQYTAVSAANAEYLLNTKRYPARKIRVIHPGCNLAKFTADHHPPAGLKQSFGFGPDDPLLVVTGRLEPQKGHRVLLDAMPAIQREFPRVRLVCVGDGSLRSELEEHARQASLADTVRFVGYWPDVRDWLALADLSLLPSFHEGLPVTPVESLAARCAVVATAVDGTPEVVVHEKTGLTVPPGDAEALAAAVCRLLGSPDLRRSLASAGRKWVLERFTRERMIKQMQDLYLTAKRGKLGSVEPQLTHYDRPVSAI